MARTDSKAQRWAALMREAQRGDGPAYARLLSELAPVLRGVMHRHGVGDAALDRALGDVLMTIHRCRHTYQPGQDVLDWAGALAEHRARAEPGRAAAGPTQAAAGAWRRAL